MQLFLSSLTLSQQATFEIDNKEICLVFDVGRTCALSEKA